MKFEIIIEEAAEYEWNEAVDWYEEREPGAGLRFNSIVWEYLEKISTEFPRFPQASRLTQRAKIRDWPYSIFFVVNESHRQISVVAIWHGRRKPAILKRRFK